MWNNNLAWSREPKSELALWDNDQTYCVDEEETGRRGGSCSARNEGSETNLDIQGCTMWIGGSAAHKFAFGGSVCSELIGTTVERGECRIVGDGKVNTKAGFYAVRASRNQEGRMDVANGSRGWLRIEEDVKGLKNRGVMENEKLLTSLETRNSLARTERSELVSDSVESSELRRGTTELEGSNPIQSEEQGANEYYRDNSTLWTSQKLGTRPKLVTAKDTCSRDRIEVRGFGNNSTIKNEGHVDDLYNCSFKRTEKPTELAEVDNCSLMQGGGSGASFSENDATVMGVTEPGTEVFPIMKKVKTEVLHEMSLPDVASAVEEKPAVEMQITRPGCSKESEFSGTGQEEVSYFQHRAKLEVTEEEGPLIESVTANEEQISSEVQISNSTTSPVGCSTTSVRSGADSDNHPHRRASVPQPVDSERVKRKEKKRRSKRAEPASVQKLRRIAEEESGPLDEEVLHLKEKNVEIFICPTCGKAFDVKGAMSRHMNKEHLMKKEGYIYECEHCQRRFKKEEHLRKHEKTHDSSVKFKCDNCIASFRQKNSLIAHRSRVHQIGADGKLLESLNFGCERCKSCFGTSVELKRHMEWCLNAERIKKARQKKVKERRMPKSRRGCSGSAKKNKKSDPVILGEITPLPRQKLSNTCPKCEYKFASAQSLRRHVEHIHKGQEIDLSKKYETVSNARSPGLPYACSECLKRFATSASLTQHKRRHVGDKPYECQSCGKRYVLGSELRKHIKRVHTPKIKIKEEVKEEVQVDMNKVKLEVSEVGQERGSLD